MVVVLLFFCMCFSFFTDWPVRDFTAWCAPMINNEKGVTTECTEDTERGANCRIISNYMLYISEFELCME